MKYFFFNIVFLFGSVLLIGQGFQMNEVILEPDIKSLVPFSADQLDRIKQNNVRRVEEVRYFQRDTLTTTYFFNEAGQLVRESDAYTEVIYKYNLKGKLILKKRTSECLLSHDSLIYDSQGRLIFYDSYETYIDCGHPDNYSELNTNFELRLLANHGNHVLIDIQDSNYPIYYELNSENQTILRIQPDQRDSISKEFSDSTNWQEIFWQKSANPPYGYMDEWKLKYRIIQTRTYKDSLLTEFNMVNSSDRNDTLRQEKYYYNKLGQPIHLKILSSNVFYNKEIFIEYDTRHMVSAIIERRDDKALAKEYHSILKVEYRYFEN